MPEGRPLQPGDPAGLGPYKILGRLGEGGQGVVFLGRAPHSDYVAIKLLHARLSEDSTARARFVRELGVAKQVARFCTAQILDADVAGDQPYIVSEYVDGRSLHALVKRNGPRTGGGLERLAIGTLTALTAIHQAGIVHRDFKPHNVMLGSDGPRVIDFGVARALGATGDTQDIGTPSYMAPEQLTAGGLSPATDIFAWGATMVFAATGRSPFGNDEVGAVMHRILHGEPEIGPLPSPLREVVTACLVKDPALRPTARDAQQRLLGAEDAEAAPVADGLVLPEVTFSSAVSSMGTPRQLSAGAPPTPSADSENPPPAGPETAPAQHGLAGGSPAEQADGRPADSGSGPAAPAAPAASAGAGRSQTTLPGPEREPKNRSRRLAPMAAGVVVGALLLGVPLWAATRNDGANGPARKSDEAAAPGAVPGRPNAPGGTITTSASATPTGQAQSGPAAPGESPRASSTGSGSSGGGAPAPNPPKPTRHKRNPYTATQVCNSGGHGGGYYVQRSSTFTGGATYQLYNSSGYNCVVTLKTARVGQKTRVWALLKRQSDGKSVRDDGSYSYYAGPVFLSARGTCVAYSGGTNSGSTSASWANCG